MHRLHQGAILNPGTNIYTTTKAGAQICTSGGNSLNIYLVHIGQKYTPAANLLLGANYLHVHGSNSRSAITAGYTS